jgi:hypothetical protein
MEAVSTQQKVRRFGQQSIGTSRKRAHLDQQFREALYASLLTLGNFF